MLRVLVHLGSVLCTGQAGTACNVTSLVDPGENQRRREAVVGVKGKVPFEAGDALLVLPISSTASLVLLSSFSGLQSLKSQKLTVHLFREVLLPVYGNYGDTGE